MGRCQASVVTGIIPRILSRGHAPPSLCKAVTKMLLLLLSHPEHPEAGEV